MEGREVLRVRKATSDLEGRCYTDIVGQIKGYRVNPFHGDSPAPTVRHSDVLMDIDTLDLLTASDELD